MTVEQGWACLTEGCYAHGEGPGSDRQAEKHGKAFGHGTHAWTRPVGGPDPGAGGATRPAPSGPAGAATGPGAGGA